MSKTKSFQGVNVFMSRNLVPPEVFDTLHDAVKHNGAQIQLCCDPSRNGPNDYHIISCSKHEKFQDLKSKGCKMLGPRCVLLCAKERKPLPKQGFTCCFAMDGVKILASGFDADEKVKIEELVTEMGGALHTKPSSDLNFVIVKNVLALKYKWALNVLKKPIVTYEWLKQCSDEHRVVPQESYKVLPFSGLKICVTGISADKRKEMEKLILQNGGKYSAELTKNCTHLICDAPEGDKYKVAKRWGHIHIVTIKWFDQSIARRACLNEESYPVQSGSLSSRKVTRHLTVQHSQEKDIGKMQSGSFARAADSNMLVSNCAESMDIDSEATQSQHTSFVSNVSLFVKEADAEAPPLQTSNGLNFDGAVANDSESDDNDLYLAECRISLVGFEASEMRKLVNLVRKGGGSRYMSLNDKLTHIVIGNPTEMEKKDVRSIAALGVVYVVKTSWLEDCDRQKKQVPVLRRHIACDLVLPKVKGVVSGIVPMDQSKSSSFRQSFQTDQGVGIKDFGVTMPESLEKNKQEKHNMGMNVVTFGKASGRTMSQTQVPDKKLRLQKITQHGSNVHVKSTNVFKGKTFCFSNLLPEERRGEIVQWIHQGGGEIISGQTKQSIHYTIECHGVKPSIGDYGSTYISSHWIRSCLEDGSLLDVDSHILYSPLPCRVPLPGFESLRFCVSQYDEKDRILLWNLCNVLGAKFVDKLTKKVTHLLCKFANGPKYEASCKWGIRTVTSEWIFECVKQNGVIAIDQFLPKEVTTQDREAGVCTVSQFPTQAVRMINDMPSQFPSQSRSLRNTENQNVDSGVDNHGTRSKISSVNSKKARLMEEPGLYNKVPSTVNPGIHVSDLNLSKDNMLKDALEATHAVPDVAAAIEDLLEQTSKVHDQRSPGNTGCERSIYPSDCSVVREDNPNPHTVFGLSKHWLNRNGRNDNDNSETPQDRRPGMYDAFSETQTESQVVSYEEDLSGRQMLIGVLTRSSMQ
ncbi:DNA topoisomerase 2-binding protein 1-A isoform X2 [Trifolium pratense]|uniref:DNA topoisomerase 2-binding protein 1-A isoform X2 n=1 Tax=Trifolium pratense TaxID=57577 RepID=UPI001E692FB7|nr:DNA topoisomerase 2-binding protein 1-A isoform X2 [Trifolium pratense]